jgi:hypothetical protein
MEGGCFEGQFAFRRIPEFCATSETRGHIPAVRLIAALIVE